MKGFPGGMAWPAVPFLIAGTLMAQPQPVSIPFVGCETGGQHFQEAPKAKPYSVRTTPELARGLAYYQSANGLGVLAPRGWDCVGTVGFGGDQLYVAPKPVGLRDRFQGPVVKLIRRRGGSVGRAEVAEVIMRVFPAYQAVAGRAAAMFPQMVLPTGPYPADQLTYEGKASVQYTTPANSNGLGTFLGLGKSSSAVHGVALLLGADREVPDLLLLAVRLPPELPQAMVPLVIRQVQGDARNLP